MNYNVSEISTIINGQILSQAANNAEITNVAFDSRKINTGDNTLFIAIQSTSNDGHKYIRDAYDKGVRNFIIQNKLKLDSYTDSSFIKVDHSVLALQKLAQHHRKKFSLPIVAIAGSNGKTIIKEWLSDCLDSKYNVCKNPLSYNSQLGVPLSVLLLNEDHQIAIFEAGISESDEMINHQKTINSDFGIFSNIGDAHDSGFESMEQKLNEKLKLFSSCKQIIYDGDDPLVSSAFKNKYPETSISWGQNENADIKVATLVKHKSYSHCHLIYKGQNLELSIPFINDHLINNCLHVISFLILDNWSIEEIQTQINQLSSISKRLEIKEGLNNCLLINDSYSLDMSSMNLGLEYLDQYSRNMSKVLFLSGFEQQKNKSELYKSISALLKSHKLFKLILIGFNAQALAYFDADVSQSYNTTNECLLEFDFSELSNSCILIKGARRFHFEDIFEKLSLQAHQTVLETDFNALEHNLRFYRSHLQKDGKIMCVIKAEAYGSGSIQLARFLESKNVDYLAVALLDEAVKIRQSGCSLPIMIFNIQNENLDLLWKYDLEPEVYSINLLNRLIEFSNKIQRELKIHLKIESGMHRLGFMSDELQQLIILLKQSKFITVKSMFSHLASSENKEHDDFTKTQVSNYISTCKVIESALDYTPDKHILNTGGIIRFPQFQFNMVRLGLGLYGIDETNSIQDQLEKAHCLKAQILQIKTIQENESTGYGRSGTVHKTTKIAVISIGYADGLMRKAGNGNYSVLLNDQLYPTIGNICMDVSMIDISSSENIKIGDEAIVFDKNLDIKKLALVCETISYEIISRIAPRVKRVYIHK